MFIDMFKAIYNKYKEKNLRNFSISKRDVRVEKLPQDMKSLDENYKNLVRKLSKE